MKQIVDVPAIKHAVQMGTVLEAYGIQVRRGKALCPFHGDRHPSMKVYRDGYFCFACGNGGDTITFVARHDGVSNAEAALRVAAIGGVVLPEDDYRGRVRARQKAQERRLSERRREADNRRYQLLCVVQRCVVQRKLDTTEPFSDEWCGWMNKHNEIEVELDELFERLATT